MYAAPYQSTITWVPLDSLNGNFLQYTYGDILLFRGAGTATIRSVADPFGRTNDITVVPGANVQIVAPLVQTGFQQLDGSLYIDSVGLVDVAFLTVAR
jgi:hypothetical protein